MSAENHTPGERAAVREALTRIAVALESHPITCGEMFAVIDSNYPALPPLPTIERWVVEDETIGYTCRKDAENVRDKHNPDGRIFRLAAVEEVTPTQPERVVVNEWEWTKGPAGWRCDQKGASFGPYEDFLDHILSQAKRIAELKRIVPK